VEYLFQQGEISKGVFRKGSHLKIMDGSGVQGMEADLLDHDALHEAVEGVDTIYSLASQTPWGGGPSEYLLANTEGIRNLLEVAVEMKVKSIVHLSTLDVYGPQGSGMIGESTEPRPVHPYQRAKLAADQALIDFANRNAQPRVAVIRAAKAIGARDQSWVVPILTMIETGRVVVPAGAERITSLSHPKDIAQAMYRAATTPSLAKRVYLVKSFDATPVDVITAIVRKIGKPAETKKQGLLGGKSLFPDYTLSQMRSPVLLQEQKSWVELGYSPDYDVERVSEEVSQWYKKEPWVTEML
jgi:nucleoside-diphosphate-sugar epimerase